MLLRESLAEFYGGLAAGRAVAAIAAAPEPLADARKRRSMGPSFLACGSSRLVALASGVEIYAPTLIPTPMRRPSAGRPACGA